MTDQHDYTTTFVVPTTPDEAYDATAHPQQWWNEMITGQAAAVGDVFVHDVPRLHHAKFIVTEATPGRRLTWRAEPTGATTELAEWIGTDLIFDFTRDPEGTRVTFTHKGLHPGLECHTTCTTAWSHHLTVGLQSLLTAGQADPITAESAAAVAAKVGAAPAP